MKDITRTLRRHITGAAALLLLFAVALSPGTVTAGAGAGKTVFDLSHNEIFSPVKEGPLNYTGFYSALGNSGEDVAVTAEKISAASLKGVKTYIVAGPSAGFSLQEAAALRDFVKDGGNLLILLHISGPAAVITEPFGIIVSNFVISEKSGLINGESQDFLVTRFIPHPVTRGLKRVAVYGTWGLLAEGKASVVAKTSKNAWADMNRDRKFDPGEPSQEFGIIAVSEHGKGKVVVVADDAPFANKFIGEADNRKLAENIIGWFRK